MEKMIVLISCLVNEYLLDLAFLPDFKDQFEYFLKSLLASVMKDCPSVGVLFVDVGSTQDQSFHGFDVPLLLKGLDCFQKSKSAKDSLFLVYLLATR